MCGNVGVAGDIGPKEKSIFHQLLYADMFRGQDATGICVIDFDLKSDILKDAVPIYDLMHYPDYDAILKGTAKVLIGHNRAGTRGANIPANAHPFEHDHIIGVHNGTLPTSYDLMDHRKFTVDSDNLFYHIANKGIEDAYSKMDGAAALVWWDDNENSLNFLRNDQRTLHYARSEDNTTLYWASEYKMLDWILTRNNVKKLGDTTYCFTPHEHYKMEIPFGALFNKKINPFIKATLEPRKPKIRPEVSKAVGRWSVGARVAFKFTSESASHLTGKTTCPAEFAVRVHIGVNGHRKLRNSIVHGVTEASGLLRYIDMSVPRVLSIDPATIVVKEEKDDSVTAFPTKAHILPFVKKESKPRVQIKHGKLHNTQVKGPKDSLVTVNKWIELVRGGCMSCLKKPSLVDSDEVLWGTGDEFYCSPECVTNWSRVE